MQFPVMKFRGYDISHFITTNIDKKWLVVLSWLRPDVTISQLYLSGYLVLSCTLFSAVLFSLSTLFIVSPVLPLKASEEFMPKLS